MHRAQHAYYARMTGSERVERAIEMTLAIWDVSRAGIRSRHPEYNEATVEIALRRLIWGEDLFHRAFPDSPNVRP
jgi:hypothetical protein